MITRYPLAALIFIASAPLAHAANLSAPKPVPPFGIALNACLAQPGAQLLDCAAEAGRRSGSRSVTVERHLDFFSSGESEPNDLPPTADIVHECGTHFCDVFDCYEEDESSICDWVGQCVITDTGADCRVEL